MNTKTVPIKSVKINPSNPRTISDLKMEQLVKSIQGFPQMLQLRPIVVNDDMVVLGGNMRLKACELAGLKKVPIIKASDLTPEQQREFIIKDNIGFGSWDWELIAADWDKETLADWGLETFDLAEINSDDFFEDDFNDDKNEKTNIVLEYSAEDFDKVTAAFDAIDGSKEDIVWNFLGLQ